MKRKLFNIKDSYQNNEITGTSYSKNKERLKVINCHVLYEELQCFLFIHLFFLIRGTTLVTFQEIYENISSHQAGRSVGLVIRRPLSEIYFSKHFVLF